MRLIFVLTLLLATAAIANAQQPVFQGAAQTRSYRRVALQGDGYPVELRDNTCLMGERKDVQMVDALPSGVEDGSLVLMPGADADYLFKREYRGWRLLAKFRGKWEAQGILLEMGPCRIKTFE